MTPGSDPQPGGAATVPSSARRPRLPGGRSSLLLALPLVLVLVVGFVLPAYEILSRSVTDFRPPQVGGLDNYGWFFQTDINLKVLQRTFTTAALVTVVCLLVGYPYAYAMTVVGPRLRAALVAAAMVSLFTSFMVRNYAWLVLLQPTGPINDGLEAVGVGRLSLTGNVTGVVIGMSHSLLPFMILPIYAAMRSIDRRLLTVAGSLGARPSVAFARVYVPLSMPGISAGALIVFVITLGFYVTPTLLGSPQQALLSQLIVTQISQLLAWGRAGTMAMVLIVVTLVLLAVLAKAIGRLVRADSDGAGRVVATADAEPSKGPARVVLVAFSVLALVFLILPTLVVFPLSFTGRASLEFPPSSWSLQWYEKFFTDPEWYGSLLTSLRIGAIVTVVSIVLGTAAALGVARSRWRGAPALQAFIILPTLVPVVVLAAGTYALFLEWRIVGSTLAYVLAHTVLAVPFVFITVSASLRTFDRRLETAAASLGASPWRTFVQVTLPIIRPSMLAGGLFAFLMSFDDVVVALFLATPDQRTIPVQMYNSVTRSIDPTIAAASSMILVLTVVVMTCAAVLIQRRTPR